MTKILLAERETRAEFDKRLRESPGLSHLADWIPNRGDPNEAIGAVCATRSRAISIVEKHPNLSGTVVLDGRWVAALSPNFVAELLSAWPDATFVNLNEDDEETVEFVRSRLTRETSK